MNASEDNTRLSRSMDAITKQTVTLGGSDDPNSYAIYGREVTVTTSQVADHEPGSNKVKISPIVSYEWSVKHYRGQQVAIDRQQKYVAYALKGRSGGIVRLIHRQLAERALIKGYKGLVVDIAFAHSDVDVLASLDDSGTLFVHKIELDQANHVVTTVLIQLTWEAADLEKRCIWCYYLPEDKASDDSDDDSDDKTMLISTIVDSKVYVFNVTQLANEHGPGPHQYNEVAGSVIAIDKHTKEVFASTFSPDGTAIATASADGKACFFQVDLSRPASPRCLYQWKPHDGQPISLLHFLDDLLTPSEDCQYWKYAVTGANNNTEIKIWSCENWSCLQTIRFVSRDEDVPCFIANVDMSSKYLILSDINHRVLYILNLFQDTSSTAAHVSSISEFVLGAPCLSFAILNIRRKQILNADDSDEDEELMELNGGSPEEAKYRKGIAVHLAAVQPKNLHDMVITFTPLTSAMTSSIQSDRTMTSTATSTDTRVMSDNMSDLSTSIRTDISSSIHTDMSTNTLTKDNAMSPPTVEQSALIGGGDTPTSSIASAPSGGGASGLGPPSATSTGSSVLLTPDAFTSSSPKVNSQLESMLVSPGSGRSSLTHITQIPDNSSLVVGGSAFDAGTASTVSSMTLTPKSSIAGSQQLTPKSVTAEPQLTPTHLPLPDSSNSTPVPSSEAAVSVTQRSEGDTQDTARQLDALFGSIVNKSNVSTAEPVLPPDLSSVPVLTEADQLSAADSTIDMGDSHLRSLETQILQQSRESLQSNTESLRQSVESLQKDLGVTQTIAVADPLDLPPSTSQAAYNDKIWPKAPEPPNTDPGVDTGVTDESDDSTDESDNDDVDNAPASSDKCETDSQEEELNVKDIERDVLQEDNQVIQPQRPPPAEQLHVAFMQDKFTSHLEDMKASILTLNEMMMSQGRDIHLLKSSERSEQKIDKLSKQIHTLTTSMNTKLEHTVNALKREQKTMQDRLISQTSTKLSNELRSLVEKSVTAEIKKSVIPSLQMMIDPVKKDLHSVMSEKLTAADATFKDSINRLVNSQATVDKIGAAVGMTVHDVIQTSYRDSLTQQVLPSFDASMRSVFSQLNSSFADGLNNYMKQLNDQMAAVKSKQMNTQAIVSASCESAVESLKQTSTDVSDSVAKSVQREVKQQVTSALDSMKDVLINDMRQAVRSELDSALQNQQKLLNDQFEVLRSSAATPVPDSQSNSQAIKTQIDLSISHKDYERAFQSALSASDLSVVIYLLKKVPDSQHIFNQDPLPLAQPTLLSLIQQLSCGLSGKHLDLIFDYLTDAVMGLDPQDAVTSQHLSSVISVCKEKLAEFVRKNPSSTHKRTVNTIEKSMKSLLRYART